LTREQTYSHLLVNVSESEAKIDKLKKDNDELRSRLHELKVNSEATENKDAGETKFDDEEIIQMREDISQ
jgi:outer membrane murein-binding lipoprotein Lpp